MTNCRRHQHAKRRLIMGTHANCMLTILLRNYTFDLFLNFELARSPGCTAQEDLRAVLVIYITLMRTFDCIVVIIIYTFFYFSRQVMIDISPLVL
jgi:hypothetical protein